MPSRRLLFLFNLIIFGPFINKSRGSDLYEMVMTKEAEKVDFSGRIIEEPIDLLPLFGGVICDIHGVMHDRQRMLPGVLAESGPTYISSTLGSILESGPTI